MAFDLKFLIVLCLSLTQCNGTPPKTDATNASSSSSYRYSPQEDKFIIEELLRLDPELPRKSLWKHVTDKHREKWIQKTPGFPLERSGDSLRHHFTAIVRDPERNSMVPESLMKTFRPDLNRPLAGKRPGYSPEEELFLIQELSNPSYTTAYAASTLEALRAKHNRKWQTKTTGFEKERSARSLRSHISTMNEHGKLPNEVAKKCSRHEKGSRRPYTEEEENFIIEELSNPSFTQIYATSALEALRAKHHQRFQAKIPGFENERTALSLRSHATTMKLNRQLPDEVVKKIWNPNKDATSSESTTSYHQTAFQGENED